MGAYAAVAGLLLSAGGAFLEGKAGDIARSRLKRAADLPGLDVDTLTGEALEDQLKYLPQSSEIARRISEANQANLSAAEESAMPGAQQARQTSLDRILELFSDDKDWAQGVTRRAAALNVGQGLFGSAAGQVRTLRLSDQERTARTQMGTGLLGGLLSTLRIANSPGVQAFLGPTPNDLINIRGQERVNRQNLLAQMAGIPGQTAAWSGYLTDLGGALMGAGMASMGGGGGATAGSGGFIGGSAASAGQVGAIGAGSIGIGCWVAREVFGNDDHRWLLFREWLASQSPSWFRALYIRHGERFAAWVRNQPRLKRIIKRWMEARIKAFVAPNYG